MIKKILVLVALLMAVTLFTSCEKFWDNHEMTEEDKYNMLTANVSFDYFMARGFNLQFVGVLGVVEDIATDEATYQFITDVSLNIDEVFIVNSKDVITIGDNKTVDENNNSVKGSYNPVFVNCNRNHIRIDFVQQTIMGGINHVRGEGGKFLGGGFGDITGTMYFVSDKEKHVFEFKIVEGMLIASAPAKYIMGSGYATMPLKGSEVERIIENGVEGVDYELFTRNNKTYVRIKNNLYERRYNSWVYAAIADPFMLFSWTRTQTSLIFNILDWDVITAPYNPFSDKNYRIPGEQRNHVSVRGNTEGSYYYAGTERVGGNRVDYYDITTPMIGCK